jgi:hypothetical protein
MTLLFVLIIGLSCKQATQQTMAEEKAITISVPEFNPDSAYHYTATQVAFGPRIPNTPAHIACGNYLANELRRFGAEVIEQETTLQIYNNQSISAKNIIASFNPDNNQRILLCAHWDSRPFADHDPDPANHRTPISGANDGAGACGALLEIARQIGIAPPAMGIDIILFDAEDWGTPAFDERKYGSNGWCLGSRYWAQNPHIPNYKAKYGILLDMVVVSSEKAPDILKKVWTVAKKLGYGDYFQEKPGGLITDDHVYINALTGIPTIDILDHNDERGFPETWHTINDTPENIDVRTLEMVGKTVITVLYSE